MWTAKKQRGKHRALGIPCLRDRVAQTAALLVRSPIVEADLAPEQYAYRRGRSAHDAVNRAHRLVNTGHCKGVDADLSDYFGQIPHAELLKSVARRVSDGRMMGWVKAWLETAVEEDDGRGGTRRTNQARRQRKGTPQGAPISPLLSHLSMRRFILGWKALGYAQRFEADIVRVGRNHRRDTGRAYIGTRPTQTSVQSICRRVNELTARRYGVLDPEVVGRLNRLMTGWANDFHLGQVSPAHVAIDRHATRRLRRWLCRKHKVRAGRYVRFPDRHLWEDLGLTRLAL